MSIKRASIGASVLDCEQALHLRESKEVTREPHAKKDKSARGGEGKDILQ